jgi:hypothetical protein
MYTDFLTFGIGFWHKVGHWLTFMAALVFATEISSHKSFWCVGKPSTPDYSRIHVSCALIHF